MIIKTRYRDVPSTQIFHDKQHEIEPDQDELWDKSMRGMPIEIESGLDKTVGDPLINVCNGPFYKVVRGPLDPRLCRICPHLAEIGD